MTHPDPTSPTPDQRANELWNIFLREIRAAEQAAREERDREWCRAFKIKCEPGAVAHCHRQGESLVAWILADRDKAARRVALEEAAEAMSRGNPVHYHSAIAWLLARAKEEHSMARDLGEDLGALTVEEY